jgi:hypothetical protein
LWE